MGGHERRILGDVARQFLDAQVTHGCRASEVIVLNICSVQAADLPDL